MLNVWIQTSGQVIGPGCECGRCCGFMLLVWIVHGYSITTRGLSKSTQDTNTRTRGCSTMRVFYSPGNSTLQACTNNHRTPWYWQTNTIEHRVLDPLYHSRWSSDRTSVTRVKETGSLIMMMWRCSGDRGLVDVVNFKICCYNIFQCTKV